MRWRILTIFLALTVPALAPAAAAGEEAVYRPGSRPPQEAPALDRPSSRPPQARPETGGNSGHHMSARPPQERPGHPGRPDYDFNKPGRPGDHHPGWDRDRDRHGWDNRRKHRDRPNPYWGHNCYPYCYGVDPWLDDEKEEERDRKIAAPAPEPEKPFQSGGSFERFEDPRVGPPDDGTSYSRSVGGGPEVPPPARSDIDQYRMMMQAWQ